jgi:hypothetical protein
MFQMNKKTANRIFSKKTDDKKQNRYNDVNFEISPRELSKKIKEKYQRNVL